MCLTNSTGCLPKNNVTFNAVVDLQLVEHCNYLIHQHFGRLQEGLPENILNSRLQSGFLQLILH